MKAVQKEPERLWKKRFVKEMCFKSGVKEWQMVRAKVVTVICALCRMRQTMKRVN